MSISREVFNEMLLQLQLLGFKSNDAFKWDSPVSRFAWIYIFDTKDSLTIEITCSANDNFHEVSNVDELMKYIDLIGGIGYGLTTI